MSVIYIGSALNGIEDVEQDAVEIEKIVQNIPVSNNQSVAGAGTGSGSGTLLVSVAKPESKMPNVFGSITSNANITGKDVPISSRLSPNPPSVSPIPIGVPNARKSANPSSGIPGSGSISSGSQSTGMTALDKFSNVPNSKKIVNSSISLPRVSLVTSNKRSNDKPALGVALYVIVVASACEQTRTEANRDKTKFLNMNAPTAIRELAL